MPDMGVAVSSCFFSGGCYGTEGKTRSQDLSVRGLVHLPELSELRQMSFSYYNANPTGKSVGDCTIRALSKALGQSWEETYVGLALQGFRLGDMPNADSVWGPYLREHGFTRRLLPDTECCTVADFAADHSEGTFILSMPGRHVVTVMDGVIYDSWDSRNEVPVYFWIKEH